MTAISRADRIAGCLFAGALGDALGSAFEGKAPPSEFEPPKVLHVTDDTQLTVATCESVIEHGAVLPESIASRFVAWFPAGRITGVGSSTLKALTELAAGAHWALSGATGERSAGNGAAMRIAPLAFFLDPDVDSDRQTIRDVCRITHRSDEAYIGALAILRMVRHVTAGKPLDRDCIPEIARSLPDSRVRDRLREVHDKSLSVAEYAVEYGTTGYVVDSVPCAMIAAKHHSDLLSMIEEIVKCGGDSDSIGSMAGQIFGAQHGVRCVPSDLFERIDLAPQLREMASKLATI